MPDWTNAPATVIEAMVDQPIMLAIEAIASTVLSHGDCDCQVCSWWHQPGRHPGRTGGEARAPNRRRQR